MRKNTALLTAAVAALAAAALVGAAPTLLARGDPTGGSGGSGGTGASRGNPDPTNGGSGDPAGGTSSGSGPTKGDKGDGDGPDVKRDGEEQRDIARDAMDRMARSRFRDLRDARNRDSIEPRRDGETR